MNVVLNSDEGNAELIRQMRNGSSSTSYGNRCPTRCAPHTVHSENELRFLRSFFPTGTGDTPIPGTDLLVNISDAVSVKCFY